MTGIYRNLTKMEKSLTKRNFNGRALGEIVIRCIDLDALVAFYRDVIGLEPLRDPENSLLVFLRIAEGFAGPAGILALFNHDVADADRTRGRANPPDRDL